MQMLLLIRRAATTNRDGVKNKRGGIDYEAHTDWSPRPGPGIEIITLGFLE